MKSLILILLTFLFVLNVNAQYSREEAIQIVKEDAIGLDSLQGRNLYSKFDKIFQGDTIHFEFFMGSIVNTFDEAWVFFIDDMPIAYWSHPCRYVLFDANSGFYLILNGDWPPIPFFGEWGLFWDEWEFIIHNEVTREEAINFVTTEIIGQDSLDNKQLFSRYEEFMYNDTLWMLDSEYYHINNQYKAWAFFIDDAPIANWAHPCRVVFVNSYPGYNLSYSITEDEWPPYPYFENWNLFLEQWEWITIVDIPDNDFQKTEFDLFPNPCKNLIQLKLKGANYPEAQISIIDLNGQIIVSETYFNFYELTNIDIANIKPGLFFMQLTSNGEIFYQEKFVKSN